jgi:hemoglobin
MSNSELPPYGTADASYQAAGQLPGIESLVNSFYDYMDKLPEAKGIRDMHSDDLTETRRKLAYFLSGWLGGPKLYRQHYKPIVLPEAHKHLDIAEPERDAWMLCMEHAVHDQPYAEAFKTYLLKQLYVPAERTRAVCAKVKALREAG